MDRTRFLNLIDRIQIWQRHGERAPHKPLLLLYAFGRIRSDGDRLATFKTIEPQLTRLLERFGRPRRTQHPLEPFKRLSNDGLWELKRPAELQHIEDLDLTRKQVLKHEVEGGFPDEIYSFLHENPVVMDTAVRRLLYKHFATSLHDDIRRFVGLEIQVASLEDSHADAIAVRKRDPRFREHVLRTYQRSCCVCGSVLRLDDDLLDLDAAHIKWHAHGGPDEVPNGLALCGFHHRALDRGAWGLRQSDSGWTIEVSPHLNGEGRTAAMLWDFDKEPIRLPREADLLPSLEFVDWHRTQVFRAGFD